MISEISSTTESGERLTINLSDPYSSGIAVKEITGLGPVKADISMDRYALIDGAFLKGIRVGTRNVVLTLIPWGEDIQQLRRKLYQYFGVSETISFEVITDWVSAKSDFIVESVEPNIFSERQEVQVSLIGLDPYWKASSSQIQKVVGFNDTVPLFEFPFYSEGNHKLVFGDMTNSTGKDIRYLGDAPAGATITFDFFGTVGNLIISNTTHDETMSISKAGQFYAGEQLVVDTRQGKKTIIHNAGGKSSFITGVLAPESKWIQMHPGVNTIALQYAGGNEDLGVSIAYESLYRGI